MRDPDSLDYLFAIAITVLAYLELPWRPELRTRLRTFVRQAATTANAELLVAVTVVSVIVFVVFVAKILPRVD